MATTLYTWPTSSGTKVHWALEELGLAYELHVVDRAAREHKQPAYLAINPNGKVPALVDGDERVFESAAILVYLGDRYGVSRGLWPADRRTEALSWTIWAIADLGTVVFQFIYHGLDSPVSYPPDQRSRATAEYNFMGYRDHLSMLEARLATADYLLGEFSLADIAAADTLAMARLLGAPIDDAPRVLAWLDRCLARDARRQLRG